MTKIDKGAIRERMLALEEAELAAAREHYEAYLADSQLDDRETHDTDDQSMARTAADLAHAFEGPIHGHEAKIAVLRALDFGPKTEVEPGAVVSLGRRHFVVAVSTQEFDCDGRSYMGISLDSPIYRRMEGLAAGDTFEQNGKNVKITSVA